MCGNGAMCGARFAVLHGIAPRAHCFRTESGLVHATVACDPDDARVRIAIADPGPLCRDQSITVEGQEITLHAILVGVPHAVIVVPDVDAFAPGASLTTIGRASRHHPAFAPAGTNVNVITVRNRQTVRMRTYERGVEDETLACGTGAVASAIVATALGLTTPAVDVVTSSGRILTVDFVEYAGGVTRVTLGGEARIIVRGAIGSEALR
jgi:diaminopimelate epimerase